MSQPKVAAPGSKWVKGISAKQPLQKAAHRILDSRLTAVQHWLPLAAEKSDDDVEYVHQLRVSTRRAVEAVRVFSALIPESSRQDLLGRLRQIRLAANEARDLDVLCAEFLRCADASCEDTCRKIAEAITQRRQEAQQPIVAIHDELVAGKFDEQIENLLGQIKAAGKGKAKPTFGRQARNYLKSALVKFYKASEADLSDDEAFHNLRIRTKKLRYTMEIVEATFKPCFRKKLYGRISTLQDVMGMVNDHATAKTFFSDWCVKTEDLHEKAFFRGILLAEMKAHQDLRQAFDTIWTPRTVKKLRRQFRACCRVS
jgi:CHAD domain-containing protein